MSVDDIFSFCFTELKLTYAEARELTLWEYGLRAEGFDRAEQREWHRVRVLASILLQPHLKKGKSVKPSDLIKLPSDNMKKVSHTRQDFENFMRRFHAK